MKKIIVTGATGFIGSNLIKKLLKLDYYVYAIIRPNSLNKSKLNETVNMTIVELDLSEINKLPNYINTDCDVFCHLAWDGMRGESRNDRVLQYGNYLNSLKTIEVAKRLNCREYINTGSQAEYGLCDIKIDENTKCKPVTEYGKQKYQFFKEARVLLSGYGIPFKEARIFSLYGPGDYEGTMICSVLNKMSVDASIDLTEGLHSWNFLHIDDAVDGIIKLIEIDCPDGPYNFSGDETKILREFIKTMQKITKTKSTINYGAIPYTKSGIVGIDPDNRRLKDETGWYPKTDFEHGIKSMIGNN